MEPHSTSHFNKQAWKLLKTTVKDSSTSADPEGLGSRPAGAQRGCLALNQGAGGDRVRGNLSLGSCVCAWPSHTTTRYNLRANGGCTLIMYDWFLPPKIYLAVKNPIVRFSWLEKSIGRFSETDKLFRIGQRLKSELSVSSICSGHNWRGIM